LPCREESVQSWFHSARSYLIRTEQALAARDGMTAGGQYAVFALVLLALFSRRPSLLTHAQFFAEDGMVLYAQAYNFGWLHSLFLPQVGYLIVAPRLGTGLALLGPLQWAPLVMAIVGLLIQALPVPILLSTRCSNWASLPTRLLLAAIYVALPSSREILLVLTNAQWHMALAAALLAFAAAPRTWHGRLCDGVFLLIAGLTGPYCIILAPVVLLYWWLRRQSWTLAIFALTSLTATLQIWSLLHSAQRAQGALGARPASLLRILGGNIVSCAIFGSYSFARLAPMVYIVAAALFGLCICLYCFRFANLEWKLFLAYCAALLAASLRSPLTPGDMPAWDVLVMAISSRYWFFPILAFLWSAAWCMLYARDHLLKAAATCVLLGLPFGIVHDWKYAPFSDENFAVSVQRLRSAKPGDRVIMPIVPAGWQMELVKKSE
jgi:hypothetical protein